MLPLILELPPVVPIVLLPVMGVTEGVTGALLVVPD
jgi:hypothetical protein